MPITTINPQRSTLVICRTPSLSYIQISKLHLFDLNQGQIMQEKTTHHLLIHYPFTADNTLVVVTGFFQQHGFHVLTIEQQISPEEPVAFMRIELQSSLKPSDDEALKHQFESQVAARYKMQWDLQCLKKPKNIVIFVSRHDHVLLDLLKRRKQQRLNANVLCIISNHPDLRHEVEKIAGLPFHEVPVNKTTKLTYEQEITDLLKNNKPDLIVLARYMQVLSADFVRQYKHKIINIHHSFLPAFAGANPYQQAFHRGVKLIGATAHYVTSELDQGPIIEQDAIRVSHRYSTADLKDIGSDLECNVLSRAVHWHLEDRVIVHGNKTTIFYS